MSRSDDRGGDPGDQEDGRHNDNVEERAGCSHPRHCKRDRLLEAHRAPDLIAWLPGIRQAPQAARQQLDLFNPSIDDLLADEV